MPELIDAESVSQRTEAAGRPVPALRRGECSVARWIATSQRPRFSLAGVVLLSALIQGIRLPDVACHADQYFAASWLEGN